MSFSRSRSRELSLQVLFQKEFDANHDLENHLRVFSANFPVEKEVWDYACSILYGIEKAKDDIDVQIQVASQNWSLARMAIVDRLILRIGTFELRSKSPDVSAAVAINEAVELAKKYSTTESASFVNGLLDQIKNNLEDKA